MYSDHRVNLSLQDLQSPLVEVELALVVAHRKESQSVELELVQSVEHH